MKEWPNKKRQMEADRTKKHLWDWNCSHTHTHTFHVLCATEPVSYFLRIINHTQFLELLSIIKRMIGASVFSIKIHFRWTCKSFFLFCLFDFFFAIPMGFCWGNFSWFTYTFGQKHLATGLIFIDIYTDFWSNDDTKKAHLRALALRARAQAHIIRHRLAKPKFFIVIYSYGNDDRQTRYQMQIMFNCCCGCCACVRELWSTMIQFLERNI